MVGAVNLLVVLFVGDTVGPAIGRIIRHFKVSSGINASKQEDSSESPNRPLIAREARRPAIIEESACRPHSRKKLCLLIVASLERNAHVSPSDVLIE
jgi:hypothetical protein